MPAVIETHPLDPFLPPAARLLMLGSFPPPQTRWKMPFYYPNLQNDMWRIFGLIFFADRDHFLTADGKGFREAELRTFLAATGIAISDTAQRVERLRGNAADQSLRILEPLNLAALLDRLPACRAIIPSRNCRPRPLPRVSAHRSAPPSPPAPCTCTACPHPRAPTRCRWHKKRRPTATASPQRDCSPERTGIKISSFIWNDDMPKAHHPMPNSTHPAAPPRLTAP